MRPNIGNTHQIHAQHDRQNIAGVLAQRAKRIHSKNTRQCGAIYIAAHIMNIPEGNQPDQAHIDQCRPQVRDFHKIGCQTPAVMPDLAVPLPDCRPIKTPADGDPQTGNRQYGQERGVFRRPEKNADSISSPNPRRNI